MSFTEFSDFGTKLCGESGILTLMDDLGKPLPEGMPSYQLGGGNPAQIPEVAALYRAEMQKIMLEGTEFDDLIARYDAPQGRTAFLETVASYLSRTYGWNITAENVAVTNGSQSAFFYLFNLYSGRFSQGKNVRFKKIVLPLVPEYIGYADQTLEPGAFVSIPSHFKLEADHTFKYYVNFELLENYLSRHDDVGALAVSRPTNPTGNVLTDEELHRLASLARRYDIPLFLDNAYGLPWPHIIFTDATPYWDENVILSMSMSKIGLPSLRTGIIVARKEVITAISNLNAIVALASGSLGQALAGPLIESGRLVQIAGDVVRPYYEAKSREAASWIHQYFSGGDYALHKSEGSIFQWLLMNDLTVPTKEFYKILKARGVIVVPGEYFFFGNSDDGSTPRFETHPHYTKCLRLNYSRPAEEVERGLQIIAEEYKKHRK
ncbi:MAG: valine--pyruvate transaminase [Treponema sp.]|nr:valine--pyruvate transaminase [Treponema sp.]